VEKKEQELSPAAGGGSPRSGKSLKTWIEEKGLAIILAALCVVAVVLVGFVIAGFSSEGRELAGETEESEDINYAQEEYKEYVDDFNDVEARVQELLNENPVDVNAIRELYAQNIQPLLEYGDYSRANSFIYSEKEALLSKGFKREALDALTEVDYSIFPEPSQYRRYRDIIQLAEELGDTEVIAKYQPLADKTKAAYDANYAATAARKAASDAAPDDEDEIDTEDDEGGEAE